MNLKESLLLAIFAAIVVSAYYIVQEAKQINNNLANIYNWIQDQEITINITE